MNKIVAISIVISIIIISIIGFSIFGTDFFISGDDKNRLSAVITVDKTITRIGDGFNFSAENSSGKIIKYSWDFGDGKQTSGLQVAYVYKECGWYNVTLNILSENGNEDDSSLIVGVQRKDQFLEWNAGRLRNFRPMLSSGYGFTTKIGPSIARPTIDFRYELYNVVGNIRFEITVEWNTPDDSSYYEEIHTETYTATVENVIFDYTVNPNELPEEVQTYYSEIRAMVYVDQARWGDCDLSINVVFPIEDLN